MRKIAVALLSLAFAAPLFAEATTVWNPVTNCYELSWDAVDPSTDTASVGYQVYMDFGHVTPVTPVGDLLYQTETNICPPFLPNLSTQPFYGPYAFTVVSTDNVSGLQVNRGLPDSFFFQNITRGDAIGSQIGSNQQWNVGVQMQADAKIYAAIYPPFTTFTANATATQYTPSAAPIRVLVDNVSYSGMGTSAYEYTLQWDSRDSSATIMANGIYPMMIAASDNTGVRDTTFVQFPVDIMRFMSLSATGITALSPTATINYDINAAGLVTILFCQPGTQFGQPAAQGAITFVLSGTTYTYTYQAKESVPVDGTGTPSGANLLRVMRFYRAAGAQSESWNGRDQYGNVLARGIYAYAISARDDYGNVALDASGNDGPIAGTINIDFNSPSSGSPPSGGGGGGGGSSDTTAPTVDSITPANLTTVTTTLTSISAAVSDNVAISSAASSIVLRDISNATVPGTASYSNGVLIYTLTPPLGRTSNGSYTAVVQAVDSSGNSSALTTSGFTLAVTDPNVFASGAQLYSHPNPAQNVSSISFSFSTTRTVPMTLQIFNILGELVHEESFSSNAGLETRSWNLTNAGGGKIASGVYIYRLRGEDSQGKQEVSKKFVVVQ